MLVAFVTFLVLTSAFLWQQKVFKRRVWTTVVVFAFLFALFLAYLSVSTVWTPHPLSDDVFREQNAFGEYEGVFPFSRLSYPLYLSVYHTPFSSLTFNETSGIASGQVRFSVLFAGEKIIVVDGVFHYFYPVFGPMPLYYKIDFIFSDSPEFFDFPVATFTLFNIIGALLGIILAKILHEKVSRRGLNKIHQTND
jgi:hypothetical protein